MSNPAAGWSRVAAGVRLVARAASEQAAKDVGTTALRTTQHGVEFFGSVRNAASVAVAPQQPAPPMPSTTDPVATTNFTNAAATNMVSNPTQQRQQQQHYNTPQYEPNGYVPPNSGRQQEQQHPTHVNGSTPQGLNHSPLSSLNLEDDAIQHQQQRRQQQEASTNVAQSGTPKAAESLTTAENQIRTASSETAAATTTPPHPEAVLQQQEQQQQLIREGRAVPSTRIGRAAGFASLGIGLAMGTVAEGVSRLFGGASGGGGGGSGGGSIIVNDANSDRLAASLCRMRGAALKMGQMLSIQDESLLPPALSRALKQVRQGADAMPRYQLHKQLETQLGKHWRDRFVHFEDQPFAAASIGQVHRARIRVGGSRSTSHEVKDVVVKVQYPGVGQSIESDLRNLSMLVTMTGLAPKGLFIENVIRVGTQELQVECDYRREMLNQKRIKQLVESDPVLRDNNFYVPDVVDELTTDEILTSEYMPGGTIDKVEHMDQEERNRIGRTILYLTMRELFDWRFMQTDPNWGNFLYDVHTQTTTLIDFGATREYSKDFVDGYLRIVWASANRDEPTLMEQSHRMSFLTGEENEIMLRAHKLSGFTVGEPFWESDEPFDFRGSNISTRMGEHTAVFLKHRLTPPPEEVYTLHRKLAGAYMLCIKLGAKIHCRDMLEDIIRHHHFTDGLEPPQI